jgi:acyl-CoA synthetase (AMP-forming)/AMP-acid ligase II
MSDTMAAILSRNAAQHGGRPAIINAGRRYTHAEHAARAWALADAVKHVLGVPGGSRMATLSQNSSECLEIYAAAEVGGLMAVPMNWRLAAPEIARVLDDADTNIIFVEDRFAELFAAAASAMRTVPPRVIRIGPDYESLLAQGDAAQPALAPAPDDVVHIIYTSGTTGTPKGVMLNHGALARSAAAIAAASGAEPDDRIVTVMPLFHSGAKIEWSAVQVAGGACVLLSQFDPDAVLGAIEREHATMAHLAPVMVNRLVEHPRRAEYDVSTLRRIHYGSAPVPAEEMRRANAAFGPVLAQLYGMTENVLITMLQPDEAKPDGTPDEQARLASAGRPYPGAELRIAGADAEALPDGEVGEILVRSPGAMTGYWRRPETTRDILRDGWIATGDMGRVDAAGFLYIVDRKKDMIVSGGENVYSREVEDALLAHPAVAEVAVTGVPDARWGEAVTAYVGLRAGESASEAELIAHCRSLIAGYKRPQTIHFVAALPRLPHGKVDKKALRASHRADRSRQI